MFIGVQSVLPGERVRARAGEGGRGGRERPEARVCLHIRMGERMGGSGDGLRRA